MLGVLRAGARAALVAAAMLATASHATPLCFAPAVSYPVGDRPIQLALEDLDGDGDRDLAIANHASNTLSVRLGNGDGTFGAASTHAVGSQPSYVVAADVDENGAVDLLAANYATPPGDGVSILPGLGGGAFGPQTTRSVGAVNPHAMAIADLDGDTNLDLVFASQATDAIVVARGDGSGAFGSPASFPVDNDPVHVAVGDFDGDTVPDLAAAHYGSSTVGVLLGNGDGTFGAVSLLPVGPTVRYVALGDVNEDGRLDIVAAIEASDQVAVLLGDGAGGFASAVSLTAGNGPRTVALTDLDGDGHLDIVVAAQFTSTISLLYGDGAGDFVAPTPLTVGTAPYSVGAGDLDGDGDVDIAVTNDGSDDVSVLLNQGTSCRPLGPLLPADLIVSSGAADGLGGDVAFGAGRFASVWAQDSDIFAQLFEADGVALAGPVPVSQRVGAESGPAVAFDGTRFLVVWNDNNGGNDVVRARAIDTTGALLGTETVVSDGGAEVRPGADVAFDGTGFLVVWSDSRNVATDASDVWGQRITLDVTATPVLDGGNFRVSPAPGHQQYPAVAFGGGTYLVAWQHDDVVDSGQMDVRAALVTPVGVASAAFDVSTAPSIQRAPDVAFGSGSFLVAWNDIRGGDDEVRAARVTTVGALVDGPAATGGLVVSSDTGFGSPAEPAVAFDGTTWLVVWSGGRTRGARMTPAGANLDPAGFDCYLTGSVQFGAGLATRGTAALVTWQDQGLSRRMAQLVGATATGGTTTTTTTITTTTLPGAVCGNGVVEGGEQCDDGNGNADDCCTPACALVADGAACSDGVTCTSGDACAAGTCAGVAIPDRDGDGLCDAVDVCPDLAGGGPGDGDADGVGDACDTCPLEGNPDQLNGDGTGGGDVCDPCPTLVVDTCQVTQSGGVSLDASGGTLVTPDGRVGITVPPGALAGATSVSITESVAETQVAVTPTAVRKIFQVELGPDGMTFAAPVTVRFTWDDVDQNGLVDGFGSPFELRETQLRVWRNGVGLTGPCASPAHQAPACATACGGRRCCCDMGTNTWEFEVLGFSQYVVGELEAMLIAGTGSARTDCLLEWDVVDPYERKVFDGKGILSAKRSCVDGDRHCDADGLVNGACTFTVRACANVADERLVKDGAVCTLAGLERVVLRKPTPVDARPVRAAAAMVVRSLVAGLGAAAIDGERGEVVTFTPPVMTSEACTDTGAVIVPLLGKRKAALALAVHAITPASPTARDGIRDADRLKLTCLEAP